MYDDTSEGMNVWNGIGTESGIFGCATRILMRVRRCVCVCVICVIFGFLGWDWIGCW